MKLNLMGSGLQWMGSDKAIAVQEDCLTLLKTLEDNSVDLIIADPPFKFEGSKATGFNAVVEYFSWAKQWVEECMRVLKPEGTMYLFGSTQNMPLLDLYFTEHHHIINRIVWHYDSSGTQTKTKFGSLYEPILMVSRSNKYYFNREAVLVKTKGANRIDYRKTPPRPYSSEKVPGNVWQFNRVRFKMEEYENHPNQKPEKLLERMILASSKPGDLVLDLFAGSFSASATALRLGRLAVGVENNPEYFKIGLRRTGITDYYQGEILRKDLSRKTANKNLHDHRNDPNFILGQLVSEMKSGKGIDLSKAVQVDSTKLQRELSQEFSTACASLATQVETASGDKQPSARGAGLAEQASGSGKTKPIDMFSANGKDYVPEANILSLVGLEPEPEMEDPKPKTKVTKIEETEEESAEPSDLERMLGLV